MLVFINILLILSKYDYGYAVLIFYCTYLQKQKHKIRKIRKQIVTCTAHSQKNEYHIYKVQDMEILFKKKINQIGQVFVILLNIMHNTENAHF